MSLSSRTPRLRADRQASTSSQLAKLIEAAPSGRPDAADRHFQRGGHGGVVWRRRCHESAQQHLTTGRKMLEARPQRDVTLLGEKSRIDWRRTLLDDVDDIIDISDQLAPGAPQRLQAFPASRRRKPAGQALG